MKCLLTNEKVSEGQGRYYPGALSIRNSRGRQHLRCLELAPPPLWGAGQAPCLLQPTPPQPNVCAVTPPISLGLPARQTPSPTGFNGLQLRLPPKKTPAWTPSSLQLLDSSQRSRPTTLHGRTNSTLQSNTPSAPSGRKTHQ